MKNITRFLTLLVLAALLVIPGSSVLAKGLDDGKVVSVVPVAAGETGSKTRFHPAAVSDSPQTARVGA